MEIDGPITVRCGLCDLTFATKKARKKHFFTAEHQKAHTERAALRSSIPEESWPVSDIPTSSLPEASWIPEASWFSYIPISGIPISSLPEASWLSDIPISDVPISDIPVSDITFRCGICDLTFATKKKRKGHFYSAEHKKATTERAVLRSGIPEASWDSGVPISSLSADAKYRECLTCQLAFPSKRLYRNHVANSICRAPDAAYSDDGENPALQDYVSRTDSAQDSNETATSNPFFTFSSTPGSGFSQYSGSQPSIYTSSPTNIFASENEPRNRVCHFCQLGFPSEYALENHILTRACVTSPPAPHYNLHSTSSATAPASTATNARARRSERRANIKPVLKIKVCKTCMESYTDSPSHKLGATHINHAIAAGLYCNTCGSSFSKKETLDFHIWNKHDRSRPTGFHCCECDTSFRTDKAFKKHNRMCTKVRRETHDCQPCDKTFPSRVKLIEHLCSKNHRPVKCLGGSKCSRMFTQLPDMIQHLESGACVSKMNRDTINRLVRTQDAAGVFTIQASPPPPPNLLPGLHPANLNSPPRFFNTGSIFDQEDDSDYDEQSGGVILTPTSTFSRRSSFASTFTPEGVVFTPASGPSLSRQNSTAETPAGMHTPTQGDGDLKELVFQISNPLTCPTCLRKFPSVIGLQRHMASPVHDLPMYHCPIDLLGEIGIGGADKHKDERVFKTLSGLTMHIASGACKGGKETWGKVMKLLEGKLAELGISGIKLLA